MIEQDISQKAHLKPLGNNRHAVICKATRAGHTCNARLGTIVRERDLLTELARLGRSEDLAAYAKVDPEGWSAEHLAIDNVPLPGPSWRILPPPSDAEDSASDGAFRKVADGVYKAVVRQHRYNPAKDRMQRSRRHAPAWMTLAGRDVRGYYPEPSTLIVCPDCGCHIAVSAEALNQPDP